MSTPGPPGPARAPARRAGARGTRPAARRARMHRAMDDWSLFITFLLGAVVLAFGIDLAIGAA